MFAACLAQNAADFYKNYWLSEWDSDISDNKTELNLSAQAISQGYKIKGFGLIGLINSKYTLVIQGLHSICTRKIVSDLIPVFCSSFKRTWGTLCNIHRGNISQKGSPEDFGRCDESAFQFL